MNIIKSDISGRHIHSPFVYRLVANVIFAPYPFYAFESIERMEVDPKLKEEMKIIFRLISFFRFEKICLVGKVDEILERTCRMAKPDLAFYHNDKIPKPEPMVEQVRYNRLVFINKEGLNITSGSLPDNPEVWILKISKNDNPNNIFNQLKVIGKVRITLELNNLGIIIFNRVFEKQDYVIKY